MEKIEINVREAKPPKLFGEDDYEKRRKKNRRTELGG